MELELGASRLLAEPADGGAALADDHRHHVRRHLVRVRDRVRVRVRVRGHVRRHLALVLVDVQLLLERLLHPCHRGRPAQGQG